MFVILFSILATILLIYLLISTYNNIKKQLYSKSKVKYEQLCPDYWEVINQNFDENGNIISIECKNAHNLGKCATKDKNTFIFEDNMFFDPETSDISKCKWAKQCGVTWQGYDNLCV
jgi:hypothetical protein